MAVKVEDRGNGRYRVRVYAGTDPVTGRPRQLSRTFAARNAKEMKAAAAKAENELRDLIKLDRQAAGSVAEAVRDWQRLHRSRHAASTQQRNDHICGKIIDGLGAVRLERLDARTIDNWYTRLREENVGSSDHPRYRSEATVRHYHSILRAVLRQAKRWGRIAAVPTEDVSLSRKPARKMKAPDTALVVELVSTATPELRFAAALAARTGLRRGELLALTWSDVRGDVVHVERSLTQTSAGLAVKDTKTTGSERTIKIDAGTVESIRAHRGYMEHLAATVYGGTLVEDGPMFPDLAADRNGTKPRRPHWLTQAWRKHAKGSDVRFHDIRHWHITMLLHSGQPLNAVSSRAGHSLPSTTLNVYGNALPEADVQSAAIIGELLAAESAAPQVPAQLRHRRNPTKRGPS